MDAAGKPGVYFEIIRPLNVFITILVVAVSFVMLDSWNIWTLIVLPLICAAGNVLNDWADADVDTIAHPDRPIPSRRMSKNDALWLSIFLFAVAIAFAFKLNVIAFILTLATVFLVVVYDLWLRGVPLLGNMAVSAATSMAFVIAGASVGQISKMLFPALLAFLLNMARELIKDIEDIEGDLSFGRKSVPTVFGKEITVWLSRLFAVAFVIVSLYPLRHVTFNTIVYSAFMLFTDYLVLTATLQVNKNDDKKAFTRASNKLKLAMLTTLLALVNL